MNYNGFSHSYLNRICQSRILMARSVPFTQFKVNPHLSVDIKRKCFNGLGVLEGIEGLLRFGFNGKENDNEVKGTGNQQDYGFRVYDPRLGKFLSVDPLTKAYPMLTPYQFASNRPIDGIDIDGLEYYSIHIKEAADGTRTKLFTVNYTNVEQANMSNVSTAQGFGPRGEGVSYVVHKYDDNGKQVGSETIMLKNSYGVYQGSDNPKKFWEPPNADDVYADDYSLPAIDETDENARKHDLNYDKLGVAGPLGVVNPKSNSADNTYIFGAFKVLAKKTIGIDDNVTGELISDKQAVNATKGIAAFTLAKIGKDLYRAVNNVAKTVGLSLDSKKDEPKKP